MGYQKYNAPRRQKLFSVLRSLKEGDLAVPAFALVEPWEVSKRLLLLDSIKRGYPTGEVYAWMAPGRERERITIVDQFSKGLKIPPPDRERGQPDLVIHRAGLIATLWEIFGHGMVTSEMSKEDVIPTPPEEDACYYDLREESFLYGQFDEPHILDMRTFMDPFIRFHKRRELERTDKVLVNRTESLYCQLGDHLINIVTMYADNVETAQEVARRLKVLGADPRTVGVANPPSRTH